MRESFLVCIFSLVAVFAERASATACVGLKEDACISEFKCAGDYGPSCEYCDDVRFNGCRELSAEEFKLKKEYKRKCALTGGQYKVEKDMFIYGDCSCPGKIDLELEGCMSFKEGCKFVGGAVKKPGEDCPEKVERLRQYCQQDTKKLILEICMCPDGEWNVLTSARHKCKTR